MECLLKPDDVFLLSVNSELGFERAAQHPVQLILNHEGMDGVQYFVKEQS